MVPLIRRSRSRPKAIVNESTAQAYCRYLRLPPWPIPLVMMAAYTIEQPRALAGKLCDGTSLFAVARRSATTNDSLRTGMNMSHTPGPARTVASTGASSMPPVTGDLGCILLLITAWVSMAIQVDPRGEFSLNDDWAYALPVKALVEQFSIRFTFWQSMTLIGQVLWGAPVLPAQRVFVLCAADLGADSRSGWCPGTLPAVPPYGFEPCISNPGRAERSRSIPSTSDFLARS